MKKNSFIFFYLMYFFNGTPIFSQNNDSLKLCLKHETNDTIRLKLATLIGKQDFLSNENYWDSLYKEALRIDYPKAKADALYHIGSIYYEQANYPKAIQNQLKALAIYQKHNFKTDEAQTLSEVGAVYFYNDNFTQTLLYSQKSLAIYKALNLPEGICTSLSHIGLSARGLKQNSLALTSLQNALTIAKKEKLENQFPLLYMNIALVYYDELQVDKAIDYGKQALFYSQQIYNEHNTIIPLYNIGEFYTTKKQYDSAEVYLTKTLMLAEKYNDERLQMVTHECFTDLYKEKKSFQDAFIHYQKQIAIRDTLYNNENHKKIIEAEAKYQFEKKETILNKEVQQKKTIVFLLIAGLITALLIIIIVVLINKQRKTKIVQQGLVMEQKLLRLQMNPHFIYNALTSLQSFINKDKKKEANDYIVKFAKLMHFTLENSREDYITLNKEIEGLESYLNINQMLLNNKFDYHINVSSDIETDEVLVPPMLIQPFIENAIKHGIQHLQQKGFITVTIETTATSNFKIEITDNGIGITNNENKDHRSYATNITKERLANILNTNITKIDIHLLELKNEQQVTIGMKTIFEIPFKYSTS